MSKALSDLAPGDSVLRMIGGVVPMTLTVTEVTPTEIRVGDRAVQWRFCKKTGAEIDDTLGWGPRYRRTGSYISSV